MAKDPAFLFYYQDFLVGTDDMTNDEVGAYIRCLCHQASKGSISEKHMMKICLRHDVFDVVALKFDRDENNNFCNERLSIEINKSKAFAESRRNNRLKKSYEKDIIDISKTYDEHMENENENEDEIKKDKRKVFKKPTIEEIKKEFPQMNAENFYYYYESTGWMRGKSKIKDWKATARNWNSNDYNKTTQQITIKPKFGTLNDD